MADWTCGDTIRVLPASLAGDHLQPFYWTSATHAGAGGRADAAVYVAFGRSLGYMGGTWMDVHGAGSQRSDPKVGGSCRLSHRQRPPG